MLGTTAAAVAVIAAVLQVTGSAGLVEGADVKLPKQAVVRTHEHNDV